MNEHGSNEEKKHNCFPLGSAMFGYLSTGNADRNVVKTELKNTGTPVHTHTVMCNFGVKTAIAFLISKWPTDNTALKDGCSLGNAFVLFDTRNNMDRPGALKEVLSVHSQ